MLSAGLALVGLAATTLADPKVLHMPMARNANTWANRIAKRAGDALVTVGNDMDEGLYYVNASVGTPGQVVELVLDTGSSDVWFFGPNSCDNTTSDCLGGTYDPSKSSTVTIVQPEGEFSIQYGTEGSNVTGNYIYDDFSVGAASVKNLTMAYATYAAYVPTGVMGIGFDDNEAITDEGGSPYPNFVDVLVSQNVINTKAYSLWLNDLDASTGSCLFGGYDTGKFSGDLLTVDIQPDEETGNITSMTVAWTSLNLTQGSTTKQVTSSSFASPALLDSGTTLTIVPDDIYEELFEFFEATSDDEGDAIVSCSLLDSADGTLDFGFGGVNGPVVKVPFSELALPAIGTDGEWLTFDDGSLACVLGLEPTEDELPVILGDTFLRSAYVVYDLTNQQISLAQTVFNSTESHVVEISSSSPIASVVSGVSVTQSATADIGQIGGTATGGTVIPTGTASVSNTLGVVTSAATSTSTSTASSTSSSKKGAAAAAAPAPGFMTSLMVAGGSMLLGSVFFMLH